MIIEYLLSILGESTNLNNKVYLLGIFMFIILHIFFQMGSVKKNKLLLGIGLISLLFYVQFGLYPIDHLGSYTHLEFDQLNSEIISPNYKSNLYFLMGMKRCSSSKEIQFRFRKLSKLLHPDRKAKPLELKKHKLHIKYEGTRRRLALTARTVGNLRVSERQAEAHDL